MLEAPLLGLSIYAAVMFLWVTVFMGRFLVPRAVVYEGHTLFVRGPFRLVRHPTYSGVLALWLGAALGTLNLLLLFSWPLALFGNTGQARAEEELLVSRFGVEYENYARTTARFLPRWPRRST